MTDYTDEQNEAARARMTADERRMADALDMEPAEYEAHAGPDPSAADRLRRMAELGGDAA